MSKPEGKASQVHRFLLRMRRAEKMYIILLVRWTPLPFVLLSGLELTPPSCSSEDHRLIEEHSGSDGELFSFSPSLSLSLSFPFSFSSSPPLPSSSHWIGKAETYLITTLLLNPALELNASFYCSKKWIEFDYLKLQSALLHKKNTKGLRHHCFSTYMRSFCLHARNLMSSRRSFGLFLIGILKSFLLML